MTQAPRVSIGLPVYNGELHLAAAIESILAQTFNDFELIISDNASTDGTAAICQRYAAQDARIRNVRQPENCGASANFDYVLKAATAPLFMWFAADDACEPDLLALLVGCHDADPAIVLATSDVIDVDVAGARLGVTRLDEIRPDLGGDWLQRRHLFFKNPSSAIVFAIYGLYRRTTLIGLSMPMGSGLRYATALEIPLLAQVACAGKIVAVAKPSKQYRWNPASMYHREQAGMRPWHKVDNHVDISRALLRVLRDADLRFAEKVPLYRTVLWGLTFGTMKLTAFLIMVQMGLRRPGKGYAG
jgi:glycosyltransferase involved in cell wall biosynthesis